jgi:hypothetical protein
MKLRADFSGRQRTRFRQVCGNPISLGQPDLDRILSYAIQAANEFEIRPEAGKRQQADARSACIIRP